jgi:hypothetical protein
LSLPLHPDVRWDGQGALDAGTTLRLTTNGTVTGRTGVVAPYDGWWSSTYGRMVPATRLEVTGRSDSPIFVGITTGDAPVPTMEGAVLVWGTRRLGVTFAGEHGDLDASDGMCTERVVMRW